MPDRMARPHPTPEKASVTAAEIIRNFGYWQQCALEAPLSVTHHGRSRVVLISAEQYEALAAGERGGPVTSDAEARRLMEHAIEGFIVYDAELRLVHVNKVARDYFGTHLDNMLMKSPGDPSRRAMHPEIEQALREVHVTRGSRALEIDSIMFPGRRLRLRLFPYGDGVAMAFLNISETQRMKAGAARMTSLRRAVQALGKVGVVRLDAREVVLFADHIVTELTGFTNADLKDQRLINFVVPEDRDMVAQMRQQPAETRQAMTMRVIIKSGEAVPMKVVIVPIGYDFSPIGDLIMFTPAASPAF